MSEEIWIALLMAVGLAWILMRLRRRPPSTPGRPWRRRIGICAGWTTAGILVLWAVADLWSRNLLEEEMVKALSLGPLNFRELLPPMPMADENGCSEVNRAGELMEARTQRSRGSAARSEEMWFWKDGYSTAFSRKSSYSTSKPWGPKEIQDARTALGNAGEILNLIRQGTDRPHLRYPLDLDTGGTLFEIKLPHLQRFRAAARLLLAEARLEAEEGHADQAVEDVGRVARIGRGLEEEPILISCLVSVAIQGQALAGVDGILRDGAQASPESLAKLSETLRMDKDLGRRALLGERSFGTDIYPRLMNDFSQLRRLQELDGGSSSELHFAGELLTLPGRPWIRWQEAVSLRMHTDMIPHVEDPDRPLVDVEDIPALAILPRLLMPVLDKSRVSLLHGRALTDATRWALAVLQHRTKTGKLPASLDEIPEALIPDRPQDPWTAKPFVYRPEPDGSGFALYSLGHNRQDDGGELVKRDLLTNQPLDQGIHWKVRHSATP